MRKYRDSAAASVNSGPLLPAAGASVQVNLAGTQTLATIYSDNGRTQAANPLTADSNGDYEFYAVDGRYDIVISGTTIPTLEITDILLIDMLPADLPTTPPGTLGPTLWNNGGALSIGGSALLDESGNIFILDQSKLG